MYDHFFLLLLQDDIEFGDMAALDDHVESFLTPDDGDGRDLFGILKRNPTEQAAETSKGNNLILCLPIITFQIDTSTFVFSAFRFLLHRS